MAQTRAASQPDRPAPIAAALLRPASDQRLVEHARAGSEAAFEALFRRYRQPLLAYCQRMLGSEAEAEDAVQQTFLAAYLTLGRLEHAVAFRAWLYGIARHRCLSVLRMRRDRAVEPAPEPTSDRLVADVVARDDLRAVLTDLAELPDEQRIAIVLAELGDVPHDQVARILGCRHDKVKALVFQGRASLTATRAAREKPCAEIQQQLIALRGGALRRATLRRHLSLCATCREFREQLSDRRRGSRMLLPALALKRGILGPLFGGAGETPLTAGAMGTGGLAATALTALVIHGGGLVAAIAPSRDGTSAAQAAQWSAWTTAPTGEGATLPPVLRWRVGASQTALQPSGREMSAPVADRAQAGRRPPAADPTTQTKGAAAPEIPDHTDRPAGADQAAAPSDNGTAAAVSGADQATTGSGHGKADPADQPAAANASEHAPAASAHASEHAPAGAAKPATPPAEPAAQGNDVPAAPGRRITPPEPDQGVAPPRATPTTAPAPSTSAPSPVTDPA
ncbi:MAG TPA: sigma-70 family RNA polymerase sigma factor, partial [Thermoleophilaceae bacterium]